MNAYFNRGDAWYEKGEYDKAIADYTEVIQLNPKNLNAYLIRGDTWLEKGEYDKAIADYTEVIRLDPKNVGAYNALSWIYATCSDEKWRDGKKAIKYAIQACELTEWKDYQDLEALASAYAESGQFDEAIKWQEKTIELAPEESKDSVRPALELYKSGKPYRQESPK